MDGNKYQIARPKKDTVYYTLKKANPQKGRRTFAVLKHVLNSDGKRVSSKVKLESVDAINRQFQAEVYSFAEAERLCKEVLEQLYRERDRFLPKPLFYSQNAKALEEYWRREYTHRDLIAPEVMHNDLKCSIEAVGMLSLVAATREELQAAIDTKYTDDPNKQRRVVTRLNQILKFLKRDFTLRKKREVKSPVKYLTMEELEIALRHIRDPQVQILCWVGFATGLRVGEIFALKKTDLRQNYLQVTSQLDRQDQLRDTKNRLVRRAYVIEQGSKYLQEWFTMDKKDKDRLRTMQHAKVLGSACAKAFKDKEKVCCFHDLRHSYAIHLLQKGVPLSHVAQSLGNSTTVCEKYYTGFMLTDLGVETIERILKQNAAR
ncbi:MAG: site-specific integrase [Proteobacteria bacterium]|nr:site-specific integrase [Pseudomonadota bacterium]